MGSTYQTWERHYLSGRSQRMLSMGWGHPNRLFQGCSSFPSANKLRTRLLLVSSQNLLHVEADVLCGKTCPSCQQSLCLPVQSVTFANPLPTPLPPGDWLTTPDSPVMLLNCVINRLAVQPTLDLLYL